jgi:hypothetical protein
MEHKHLKKSSRYLLNIFTYVCFGMCLWSLWVTACGKTLLGFILAFIFGTLAVVFGEIISQDDNGGWIEVEVTTTVKEPKEDAEGNIFQIEIIKTTTELRRVTKNV